MSDVVDISISGDVHGQVAAGNFVYQAQSIGGVINQYTIEGEVIVARSCPLYERPPRRDTFVGRVDEIEELLDGLERGPVQVFGEDGVGKTWLVGHVTHHQRAHDRRDGIAYVDARRGPLEDVLQALFDVFFDSRLPQIDLKATPTQIRQAMADREAFVVVDHLDVARSDVDHLLQVLARCTVVLAGEEETLFGAGEAIPLRGLDPSAAVALFAQEARRDLAAEEAGEAESYCSAVGGHPLTILRAARQLRRGEITVSGLRGLAAETGVRRLAVDGLTEHVDRDEQIVLSSLAAVAPEALPPEAVAALAGTGDAAPVLADVEDRGIVRAGSPRYRLPLDVAAALDLEDWRGHVLVTLPGWAGDADPELVADAAGAIEAIAAWGHEAGRSDDVSALARAVAPPLATTRRWGSLRTVLDHAHRAAESAGDRGTVGWALHELGTLDACSDELTSGHELLTRAEAIRREVGSAEELEVTRHNLRQLGLAMAGPSPDQPTDGWPRWVKLVLGAVVAAVVAIVVIVVVATVTGEDGDGGSGGDGGASDGAERAAEGFLDLDESPIDFGLVPFGEATIRERTVTNAGDAAVDIQAIELVIGDQFEVGTNCPDALDPGDTCTVAVAFVASDPGERVDRLVIASDAENREVSVDVLGVVGEEVVEPTPEEPTPVEPTPESPPPEIVVEPEVVDFGILQTGEAARAQVVVANVGGQPLELRERRFEAGEAFELDDRCPDVLEPDQDCSLVVVVPGFGGGTFEDVLVIRHSAPQPDVEIGVVAVSQIG